MGMVYPFINEKPHPLVRDGVLRYLDELRAKGLGR
jgi:hypothetical protein